MSRKPAFEILSDESRHDRVRTLHVTKSQVENAVAHYVAFGLGFERLPENLTVEVEIDGLVQGVTVRVVEDFSDLPVAG